MKNKALFKITYNVNVSRRKRFHLIEGTGDLCRTSVFSSNNLLEARQEMEKWLPPANVCIIDRQTGEIVP